VKAPVFENINVPGWSEFENLDPPTFYIDRSPIQGFEKIQFETLRSMRINKVIDRNDSLNTPGVPEKTFQYEPLKSYAKPEVMLKYKIERDKIDKMILNNKRNEEKSAFIARHNISVELLEGVKKRNVKKKWKFIRKN